MPTTAELVDHVLGEAHEHVCKPAAIATQGYIQVFVCVAFYKKLVRNWLVGSCAEH